MGASLHDSLHCSLPAFTPLCMPLLHEAQLVWVTSHMSRNDKTWLPRLSCERPRLLSGELRCSALPTLRSLTLRKVSFHFTRTHRQNMTALTWRRVVASGQWLEGNDRLPTDTQVSLEVDSQPQSSLEMFTALANSELQPHERSWFRTIPQCCYKIPFS